MLHKITIGCAVLAAILVAPLSAHSMGGVGDHGFGGMHGAIHFVVFASAIGVGIVLCRCGLFTILEFTTSEWSRKRPAVSYSVAPARSACRRKLSN
jgi:hypothetical protein